MDEAIVYWGEQFEYFDAEIEWPQEEGRDRWQFSFETPGLMWTFQLNDQDVLHLAAFLRELIEEGIDLAAGPGGQERLLSGGGYKVVPLIGDESCKWRLLFSSWPPREELGAAAMLRFAPGELATLHFVIAQIMWGSQAEKLAEGPALRRS